MNNLIKKIKTYFQAPSVDMEKENLKRNLLPLIAIVFNEWHRLGKFSPYKNRFAIYKDAECSNDGQFFTAFADLPGGRVAYLIPIELWDTFRIPEDSFDYSETPQIKAYEVINAVRYEAEYPTLADDKLAKIEKLNFSHSFYRDIQNIINL